MNSKVFWGLFLLMTGALIAQDFGYPLEGEAWYYIQCRFRPQGEMSEGRWQVLSVTVNDEPIRDYRVFRGRQERFDGIVSGARPFSIKARYTWLPETTYTFRAEMGETVSQQRVTLDAEFRSPRGRGYWDPAWKNYLALCVREEHGIQRRAYPVHATLGVLAKYLRTPDEIRVIKAEKKGRSAVYTPIAHQVYDWTTWQDAELLSVEEKDEETGSPITRYHPTRSFSVAFAADLRPRETATYLVFYNNPGARKADYPSDLSVSGKALARIIENGFYRVELDEKSGMILKVMEKASGTLMEHKLETNGAVHWNPGAYSPPHAWTHASDWAFPSYREIAGPVFYCLQRSAPLPHLQEVDVAINYYFYADSPAIVMESSMFIKEDLFVKALRNGEIVFNKEVFDQAAYKSPGGAIEVIDFSYTRMHPEHVTTLRPDTPWVAFLNADRKVAFASLFLDFSAANLTGGQASQQQPYLYIQHGPWYYISRAFVYSFGSNNQTRMLPVHKGSVYHERTAWIPLSFKNMKAFSRRLDGFYEMYTHPLHIEEMMETFPESPPGWLVPLLTEPFDEGVKGAIGVKKKK